jgi:hypothetical protein
MTNKLSQKIKEEISLDEGNAEPLLKNEIAHILYRLWENGDYGRFPPSSQDMKDEAFYWGYTPKQSQKLIKEYEKIVDER